MSETVVLPVALTELGKISVAARKPPLYRINYRIILLQNEFLAYHPEIT